MPNVTDSKEWTFGNIALTVTILGLLLAAAFDYLWY